MVVVSAHIGGFSEPPLIPGELSYNEIGLQNHPGSVDAGAHMHRFTSRFDLRTAAFRA
jgi:hypothetical protein